MSRRRLGADPVHGTALEHRLHLEAVAQTRGRTTLLPALHGEGIGLSGRAEPLPVVAQFLGTFKEFPPRQKVGSFNLDQVLEGLQSTPSGSR